MAQREGSIYLTLFIVACVLFIGTAVLFFMENGEKQKITLDRDRQTREVAAAKAENTKLGQEIRSLHELVAGPAGVEGAWPGNSEYLEKELHDKAQKAINDALEYMKEAPRTYNHLVHPYGDLAGIVQKLRQLIDESNAARAAAEDSKLKAMQSQDAAVAELKTKMQAAQQELADLQAKYEDLDNRTKAEKQTILAEGSSKADELTDSNIKLSRTLNFKENQIRGLQTQIDKLQEEAKKEKSWDDVDPDGSIVNVLSRSGKAWIDIGRTSHLRTGLVFRVFQTVKGGKKEYKGRVEVQKVEDKLAEVRIVEEKDPLNPIIAGDFVSSVFYDPKVNPIFVFAGTEFESKEVTREFVISKLKSFGVEVRDRVDLNTKFIIALKNYEGTPEYKTARELQVPVIRENDLLEFLGR